MRGRLVPQRLYIYVAYIDYIINITACYPETRQVIRCVVMKESISGTGLTLTYLFNIFCMNAISQIVSRKYIVRLSMMRFVLVIIITITIVDRSKHGFCICQC